MWFLIALQPVDLGLSFVRGVVARDDPSIEVTDELPCFGNLVTLDENIHGAGMDSNRLTGLPAAGDAHRDQFTRFD